MSEFNMDASRDQADRKRDAANRDGEVIEDVAGMLRHVGSVFAAKARHPRFNDSLPEPERLPEALAYARPGDVLTTFRTHMHWAGNRARHDSALNPSICLAAALQVLDDRAKSVVSAAKAYAGADPYARCIAFERLRQNIADWASAFARVKRFAPRAKRQSNT